MKYLLGLILLISVSASAQYSPTAAKTRFVNGIGLGTKDTLTMNAADTVAMIVGRDSLVYFRYKGYWKPLAYNSSLTGYVPYTGATGSVNLGSYNLTANKIAIGGSISAVALDVHRAGSIVARIENTNSSQDALFAYAQSAQNVWFTGIDYASGANNFGFYYSPDGTTVIRKAYFSNSGDLTAASFIKSGGTSSQFLKADGSVDANAYTKISDTATMLSGYKTYYPRAALSAGTGITYNASTGVITNSSPSTGGTVTSVATNTGSGITGGTITSSGTIAADTSVLSTKANVTASLLSKVSSVSGTSPIASSGGLNPTISISQSSGSTNGYLSSTDWTTFNNKGSGSVTSIATDATMTGGTITTTGTLKVDTTVMATRLRVQKGIDSLGAAKQGTITLTTTGTSGAATFSSNTLNIPQYQAAGTYVTSVTGTSPIVSSGGTTPAISIPAATTSVNGYLTSTDWNTFNNKQNALTNPVTGSGTTNYLPKFTGTSTIGNSAVSDDGSNINLISRNLILTNTATAQFYIQSNGGGYSASINVGGTGNGLGYTTGQMYFANPSNVITFNTKASSGESMRIDASGNLGLGVTPSAWYSLSRAIDIGAGGAIQGRSNASGTFELTTNAYLNSTGDWAYKASSVAANLYALSDGSYKWYTAPSGTAGNAISFTQAMTLFSDGNLGLGTSTNAGYKLDVNGTGRFSGALTGTSATFSKSGQVALITQSAVSLSNGVYALDVDNSAQGSNMTTAGAFRISTNSNTAAFVVNGLGNVGIGTASPATTLHVAQDNGAITLTRAAGTYGTKIVQSNSDGSINYQIGLATAGSWRTYMRLGEGESNPALMLQPYGGNVLIGTTTDAGYKLDVNGTGRFSSSVTAGGSLLVSYANARASINSTTATNSSYLSFGNTTTGYVGLDNSAGTDFGNGAYSLNLINGGAYNLNLGTSNTTRLTITSAGNVGIGTTSPSYKLDVQGTLGVTGAATFSSSVTTGIPATWDAAGAWKLGTYFATTVALNTSGYITVDIGGTLYYLALATPL